MAEKKRYGKIQAAVAVEHHVFRDRRLCISDSYQTCIAEAQAEFDTLPRLTARQAAETKSLFPGIFVERPLWEQPEFLNRISGTRSGNHRGDSGDFTWEARRYKIGWDAGKGEE